MQKLFFLRHPVFCWQVLSAVVVLGVAGCQVEDDMPSGEEWPVVFDASAQDYGGLLTKATLYNTDGTDRNLKDFCSKFITYAYKASGSDYLWSEIDMPLEVNYDGWTWKYTSRDAQMPVKKVHPGAQFFAYAPVGSVDGTVVKAACDHTGMTFTYNVPVSSEDQKDAMIGYFKASTNGETIAMKFYHPFVAVRFEMGQFDDDVSSIKKITIKNVCASGSVKLTGLDASNPKFETSGLSGTRNVQYAVNGAPIAKGICFGNMVLLPQSSGTRTLEIECNLTTGGTRIYSREINDAWESGYLYTYRIGSYIMELSTVQSTLSNTGQITYQGDFPTELYYKSYRSYGSSTALVPWKLQYSYDENDWHDAPTGKTGDWINTFGLSGAGSASTSRATMSISATRAKADEMPHGAAESFSHSGIKGTSSTPYNLATKQTSYSLDGACTANCYVVNSPGCYCLPLVYGNALRKGQPDPSSQYNAPVAQNTTGGYTKIYEAWTPASAEVLWSEPNTDKTILKNVELRKSGNADAGDKYDYLYFEVSADNISQANALVAVKDASNKILWSWHIWITDINIEAVSNGTYDYMSANMGQLTTTTKYGAGAGYGNTREVLLRLCSTDGKEQHSNVVRLTQQIHTEHNWSSLVYQFCRKDPFSEYNNPTTTSITSEITSDPVLYVSQHPESFILNVLSSSDHWWNESTGSHTQLLKMWGNPSTGANTTGEESCHKTIFDPCPYGYKVMTYGEMHNLRSNYFETPLQNGNDSRYGIYFKNINQPSTLNEGLFMQTLKGRNKDTGTVAGGIAKTLDSWSSRPGTAYNQRGLILYANINNNKWTTNHSDSDANSQGHQGRGIRPSKDYEAEETPVSFDVEVSPFDKEDPVRELSNE